MLVSLGMNYAVVNIGKIRFSGYLAWLFWNAVHLFKIVGLKKQVQVAIDWMLATIFPRDAMIIAVRAAALCASPRNPLPHDRRIALSHFIAPAVRANTSRRD